MRRRALDLTQEQLGEAVGVTGMTICNWEKGNSIPSAFRDKRLKRFLKQREAERTQELSAKAGGRLRNA